MVLYTGREVKNRKTTFPYFPPHPSQFPQGHDNRSTGVRFRQVRGNKENDIDSGVTSVKSPERR